MSDFDREAERERLREKYERDKKKREASEQMSQLLLQGATMTNQHCKGCHSPVFRYEGREFCPTCQKEVDENGDFIRDVQTGGDGQASADDQRPEANGQQAESKSADQPAPDEPPAKPDRREQPTDSRSEPTADAGTEPAASADRAESAPGADHPESAPTADRPQSTAEEPTETRPAPAPDRRPARVDPPARRETPDREATEGDLGEAEATLVREITALTRRAEETRDVGRKRDLLAAAREAAETLQTVRRL